MSANLFNWPDKVGVRGQRLELSLRFIRRVEFSSGHSERVYLFTDESGNNFAWFTDSKRPLIEGRSYQITATVKRHRVFNKIPQTVIERPVIR